MIKSVVFSIAALLIFAVTSESKSLMPEIGAVANKSWTENQDFNSLYGFGFYLIQPVSQRTYLKVASDYYTKAVRNFAGYYSYPPIYGERLQIRNSLEAISLAIMTEIAHAKTTFLYVGAGAEAGYVWRTIKDTRTSEQLYRIVQTQSGFSLEANLLVNELKGMPLVMRFGFIHRFLRKTSGKSNNLNVLSDKLTTTEISFGFGYDFGRGK